MAEVSNSVDIGRFKYIEPTNMNLNLPDNAITFPYEDYSTGVRLEVTVPDRFSCGMENSETTITFSSENGTIDFFGGSGSEGSKQGYLTTNFTDISANNIGRGNRECLGIDSITISYQQWFYPIVNIRFVDVRGASLFMAQEKALQDTIKDGNSNITQINSGSFFKAIFACPSPVFKLTIMGFYGKSATFNLKMSSFQTEFDSENGNFIANVEFVGNMYGVYTEIPLQYLAIAPYLNKEYWDANASGKFAFNGNSKMLTFPEFWKAIETMERREEKEVQKYKDTHNFSTIESELNELNEINAIFNDIISKAKETHEVNGQKIAYFIGDDYTNGSSIIINTDKINSSDCFNGPTIQTLYERCKNFNKKYNEFLPTNYFEITDEKVKNGPDAIQKWYAEKFGLYKIDGKTITDYPKWSNMMGVLPVIGKTYTLDEIKPFGTSLQLKEGDGQCVFAINCNLSKRIDDLIKRIKEHQKEKDKELEEFRKQNVEEVLGFKLSIGNIFKMIFAHLDAFITEYYRVLKNIADNKDKRTLTEFGISKEKSDLPDNITSVPPFPLFFDRSEDETGKNEAKWPEDLVGENKMDETIFVNRIIAASHNYLSAITEAQNFINNFPSDDEREIDTSSDSMIQLTLYDVLKNGNNYNPYEIVTQNQDFTKTVEQINTIFTLRCLYVFFMLQNNEGKLYDNTIKYITFAEAMNVRKALGQKLDTQLIETLKLKDKDGAFNNLSSYLLGSGHCFSSINSQFIKEEKNNWRYTLIKKDDNDIILPLTYNISEINSEARSESLDKEGYLHLTKTEKNKGFVIKGDGDIFASVKENVKSQKGNFKLDIDEKNIDEYFKKYLFEGVNPNGSPQRWYKLAKLESEGTKSKIVDATELSDVSFAVTDSVNDGKKIESKDDLYKYVTYGTVNRTTNIFQSDIYKIQKQEDEKATNEARAYYFVFSNFRKPEVSVRAKTSGKVPYIYLLQEGAYYWRKKNDKLVYEGKNGVIHNKALKGDTDLIPLVNYESGLQDKTEDGVVFVKWPNNEVIKKFSESRREELIKLFEEFANGKTFGDLNGKLCNNNSAISYEDTLSFQKLYLSIMESWRTIIDCSARPDSESFSTTVNKECFANVYKKFIDELRKIYTEQSDTKDVADEINANQLVVSTGLENDKHLKLSTYLVLKDLYDKYFSFIKKERLLLGTNESEFDRFLFIDSYYNDISNTIQVNGSFVNDLIKNVSYNSSEAFNVPEKLEHRMSVYEFMSEICQNCEMTLLALPQRFDVTKPKYMEDMFTPHQYKDLDTVENDGCYVGIYSYKPSQFLDITDAKYAYKNDSFDITNGIGDGNNAIPSALGDLPLTENNTFKAIPAFGVTYAKQNQSIFKKINLTTANQQTTEQSIFATFDVSSKNNQGPRESTLYGQDLYRVYSSYAYQCTVEMMGNIQIMPLMYFQLNNIAMWHGAYMIISVEHNITPGDMTTKFTGVRVNKNAIPLVDSNIVLRDSDENMADSGTFGDGSSSTTDSYAGSMSETGTDYVHPDIYDYSTNSFKPAKYRPPYIDTSGETVDEKTKEKLNATWAVRSRFCSTPQVAGYCARWTYNLADSFKRGTRELERVREGVSGGWGAVDPGCHDAIRKLGYTLIFEKHNISGKEIDDLVKNKLKNSYKYGDVMFYWSRVNDYGNEDLKHHAQFYAGDAYMTDAVGYSENVLGYEKKSEGRKYCEYNGQNCGWATSTLNNYCTPFVYGSYATNGGSHSKNTWNILIYRCSRLIQDKDVKFGPDGKPLNNVFDNNSWLSKLIGDRQA